MSNFKFVNVVDRFLNMLELTPQVDLMRINLCIRIEDLHIFTTSELMQLDNPLLTPSGHSDALFGKDITLFNVSDLLLDIMPCLEVVLSYSSKLQRLSRATDALDMTTIHDILAESCVNFVETIDLYTAAELSVDFFAITETVSNVNGTLPPRTHAALSNVNVAEEFSSEVVDVFNDFFVHDVGIIVGDELVGTRDVFETVSVDSWGRTLAGEAVGYSGQYRILGAHGWATDGFSNPGSEGFLTDNLKYFSWADEISYWGDGGSMDWFDVYFADPEVKDFLQILQNTSNPRGWQVDMTSLRDAETHYLSQAGTSRIFIPRPYVASPMYNALGLPWFLDYVHLSSWFFFMAMFVLIMWINLAWSVFAKNVEARQPMRETRGFSRAQTGDGVTAVLPMTWSITMLMHASTHSVNFDENTSGTLFTLTVIAYQWGWNYYFPRDIVTLCWSAPKQVGCGGIDASGKASQYEGLLSYSRQELFGRSTNDFRSASKVGKNVAANVLSLFLKPCDVVTHHNLSLPLFLSNATLLEGSRGGLLPSRSIETVAAVKIATRLVELLDECGINVGVGYNSVSEFRRTSATSSVTTLCSSLLKFGGMPTSLPTLADQQQLNSSANQLGVIAEGQLFSRQFYREDMLRYRAQNALRSRSTDVLSGNRLLLIHADVVARLGDSRYPANAAPLLAGNDLNLSSDHSALVAQMSFMFRELLLLDTRTSGNPLGLNSLYNDELFGSFFLSADNLAVNTWLCFFNLERYFASEMRSWSSAHVDYLALLLGSQYSTSLVGAQSEAVTGLLGALGSSDPIISMALGYTQTTITPTTDSAVWGAGRGSADTLFDFSYGTIITPTSVFVSGGRHWVNSQYRQQLFTHTSPDTSFLFYYASLLTFEDFGLNFSPAVKELSNRLVGYSVYALHALTSAITPPSTGSDYPHALVCGTESGEVPFIFSDTAIRELYSRSSSSYQFNNVAKPTVCATSSQLLNLRQSAATQLNSASDLSASSSVSAPDYTHVSSTQFFNISAAGLALQVKLADSVQAQAALSTSATYVQSSTPVSDLNPVGGLGIRFLNSAISSDSAYSALEQQPVALTANVTAMPLTALTLLDLGTIFALDLSSPEIKASVIYVPAYSVPANLTQPTFITGQSADFSALHDVRPHLPNFFGYTTNVVGLSTNSPQFTLGDFFTNATIANSQRTSGLVGSNIFSFFGSSSNWHNGVDSVKPIRLGAKLQDPSIFCFKLSDLPTGRIKFANKPLFDWSHSWGTQVQTYGLPIYKMYRACLIRKVNCAFWSASSTSINTSEMQQLIWSGNTASVYLPYKNMDKPLMLIPRLFYHTNNAPTQVTSTHAVLDRDLVSFFKSHVIALPTVHEEFDINFVYRHWSPEINTTRRSDHGSRFRTTWNSFFRAQHLITAQRAGSLPISANATLDEALPNLHSNAFYVAATGNLGGSSAVLPASTASFRPVSALASPSRATFDTSVIASIVSTVHEHSGFGNAGGLHTNMSESLTSSPSANCSLRAYSYTSSPATAGSWVTIWNYSETQPTYKLSDVREHVSGTSTGYWGLRMGLLLSATMREFTRLQRNLGTSTYDLSPTANLQQYATSAGLVSSKPTYSSNLLSILARNLLDIRQRSAFEPVRSDVGSMKRLRVTKGICLPADYPIHVICGSKDVVHSWAIPGLGIKIDCIPGYNSHRRVLFRWRGIFWGQCMEVCGRYHHWMPILVRIVHRDAFLSWCLIYLRALNSRSITSRQAKGTSQAVAGWLSTSAGHNQLSNVSSTNLGAELAESIHESTRKKF